MLRWIYTTYESRSVPWREEAEEEEEEEEGDEMKMKEEEERWIPSL